MSRSWNGRLHDGGGEGSQKEEGGIKCLKTLGSLARTMVLGNLDEAKPTIKHNCFNASLGKLSSYKNPTLLSFEVNLNVYNYTVPV